MIDLETMGTKTHCAIVSIGVVIFDPSANVVADKTFYAELDWESQGRTVNQDCIDNFWNKQPDNIREAMLYGMDDLKDIFTTVIRLLT